MVHIHMGNITLHQVFDFVSGFVLVSSILGSFLPPYEWFQPWPKFQMVYRVVTMTIARWGAINVKSLIYPTIASTGNVKTDGTGGGDATPAVIAVEVESVKPQEKGKTT